jgi:16S rRNA (guanine527-N7)-methyltransferase
MSLASKTLDRFIDLFQKWNKQINLSAASSRVDIEEHVQDSLHVVQVLRGCSRVLDVGSGGGFPVVIAAVELPETQFVSLEPVHKKHAFLRAAARELGLSNLDARAERLEVHPVFDYDAATSRATFDLAEWLALGSTRVHAGGIVVGFEAQHRADISDVERISYVLNGKARALVIKRST